MQPVGECLVIRADASTQMGTGHVMRCLALGQAWQDAGGQVAFVMAPGVPWLEDRLRTEGMEVRRLVTPAGSAADALQTADLARQMEARWVVVDGYHFGAEYQRAIKGCDLSLLFIDDYGHAEHYWADLVLNQNLYAREVVYRHREPYTRLLLGTRYALLRKEFARWPEQVREFPVRARKILVTLGGSDPDNVTLKVIQALPMLSGSEVEVVVVVGAENRRYDELQAAAQHAAVAIRFDRNVTAMAPRMAWADVAVSSAGSTCWELACMGLPALVLVLAENQRQLAQGLEEAGIAENLGWHRDVSQTQILQALVQLLGNWERRQEMSNRGRQVVDGQGSRRIVTEMRMGVLRVRLATEQDGRLLLQWANEPQTRRMSFHPEPITWKTHRRWLERVLGTPGTLLMIVELQEVGGWRPVGQVRVDADGTVSLSVACHYRGRRLALPLLKAALAYHAACMSQDTLVAYIKPENEASKRVFVAAGFELAGQTEVAGQPSLKYLLRSA